MRALGRQISEGFWGGMSSDPDLTSLRGQVTATWWENGLPPTRYRQPPGQQQAIKALVGIARSCQSARDVLP